MSTCKLCASPAHTLKKCDSLLCEVVIETVTALINANPFNLWLQVQELEMFTPAQLGIVCRSFRYPVTGTKVKSIQSIINHFFGSDGRTEDEHLYTLSQEEVDAIDLSYTQLSNWPDISPKNIVLRDGVICDIETYYFRRHRLKRNGLSTAAYYSAVDSYYSSSLQASKSHLRRLQIGVVQKKGKPDSVECCVCLDSKSPVKINCGHEMCSACIMRVAASRAKSFISCPLCRTDIKVVYTYESKFKMEICFERA
jgi:hypothetical protein